MGKKVMFCATVDYHFSAFHMPYLKWFKEQGWEVHVAAAGNIELPYVDKKYNIPIQRSPFKRQNIGAYKELKSIIDDNQYEYHSLPYANGWSLNPISCSKGKKT